MKKCYLFICTRPTKTLVEVKGVASEEEAKKMATGTPYMVNLKKGCTVIKQWEEEQVVNLWGTWTEPGQAEGKNNNADNQETESKDKISFYSYSYEVHSRLASKYEWSVTKRIDLDSDEELTKAMQHYWQQDYPVSYAAMEINYLARKKETL